MEQLAFTVCETNEDKFSIQRCISDNTFVYHFVFADAGASFKKKHNKTVLGRETNQFRVLVLGKPENQQH